MKDDHNRKFPRELFWIGIVLNFIARFYLWVPGLLLLLIGLIVRSRPFVVFGLLMLTINTVLSVSDQFMIKRTFEEPTDNPEFKPYQDAIMGGNWREDLERLTNPKQDGNNTTDSDDTPDGGDDGSDRQE